MKSASLVLLATLGLSALAGLGACGQDDGANADNCPKNLPEYDISQVMKPTRVNSAGETVEEDWGVLEEKRGILDDGVNSVPGSDGGTRKRSPLSAEEIAIIKQAIADGCLTAPGGAVSCPGSGCEG